MKNHNDNHHSSVRNILFSLSDVAVIKTTNETINAKYCLDEDGSLLLYIAEEVDREEQRILLKNHHHELLISGDIKEVLVNPEAVERFFRFYPYLNDESLVMRMLPKQCILRDRLGEEQIINYDALDLSNHFAGEVESRMITHMNEDHVDAMCAYCAYKKISCNTSIPSMVGIDPYGFYLIVAKDVVRFSFENKCSSPQEVREALVTLAQTARNALDQEALM